MFSGLIMSNESPRAGRKWLTELQSHRDDFQDAAANNRFAFALGQVSRYYAFLESLFKRYAVDCSTFFNLLPDLRRVASDPEYLRNSAQHQEPRHAVARELESEIESFYLFARILLDRLSQFIEFYFGQVRGLSLHSHHDLVKHLDEYCKAKGLSIPAGFAESTATIYREIAETRDKGITHEANPRSMRAIEFNHVTHEVTIQLGRLYPREHELPLSFPYLPSLFDQLDEYIGQFVQFVLCNLDKTNLPLGGSNGDSHVSN